MGTKSTSAARAAVHPSAITSPTPTLLRTAAMTATANEAGAAMRMIVRLTVRGTSTATRPTPHANQHSVAAVICTGVLAELSACATAGPTVAGKATQPTRRAVNIPGMLPGDGRPTGNRAASTRAARRDRRTQPALPRRRRPDHLRRRVRRARPGVARHRIGVPRARHTRFADAEGRRAGIDAVLRGATPVADDVARQRVLLRGVARVGQAHRTPARVRGRSGRLHVRAQDRRVRHLADLRERTLRARRDAR